MSGFALTQFFFPSPSSRSRKPKTKGSSRSRPGSINISRNSGANIYPCIWMGNTAPSNPWPSSSYHEEWKEEPITRPLRSQRPVSLPPAPPNPIGSSWSGYPSYNALSPPPAHLPYISPPQPYVPAALPKSGQRRARLMHQASHIPAQGGIRDTFLQFPSHWDQITKSQSCFVPQPQNSPASGQHSGLEWPARPPDDITDRALHFCVVDRTGDGWSVAAPATKRYILTCSAAGIGEVISGLAPEGSGRRVSVECRTSHGEEHGGLDLLERILHNGWPFMVMIDDE